MTLTKVRNQMISGAAANVLDFGAVGDGVTDDYAAIQAAFDAAQTIGGTIVFPEGVYRCDSSLIGYSDMQLIGESATIDFSQITGYFNSQLEPMIRFVGTAAAKIAVSTTTAIGDTSIHVANTSTLSVGDLIEINELGVQGGWQSDPPVAHIGELHKIKSVTDATHIVLATPIFESEPYTTGASIQKITPVANIRISGLTVLGNGRSQSVVSDYGIGIFYGENVEIDNCTFNLVDKRTIDFISCYNFSCRDCTLLTDQKGASNEVNYGIVYSSASIYGDIHSNTISNYRHAVVSSHISSGYNPDYLGINRFISVHDNTCINTWHAGISTHNDVEYLTVENNKLVGCDRGVEIREISAVVDGNIIVGGNQGITLGIGAENTVITNNKAFNITGNFVTVTSSLSASTTATLNAIKISDNSLVGGAGGITLDAEDTVGITHLNLQISNNTFTSITGGGGQSAVIRVLGDFSGAITSNTISGVTDSTGIRLEGGVFNLAVENNRIEDITGGSHNGIRLESDIGSGVVVRSNFISNTSGNELGGGGSLTLEQFVPYTPLSGSATWDAASIPDGDEVATTITVSGAKLGDFALVSFSLNIQDLVLSAAVTNSNVVTAVLSNNTGGAIDLASGTVKARIVS